MKNVADNIMIEVLIKDYLEMNSAYRVASKHNTSATAVKRLLKRAGVLRTQNEAASIRNVTTNKETCGKYERSEEQKKAFSERSKAQKGELNPFYGKTHSEEVINKIKEANKDKAGKRNPNYKDGSYIRRPRDYKIHEFTNVRNATFNRDHHTCQSCSVKGGHLHAHHMLPFWVKPEAFLDIENLITLCTSCHFKVGHNSNWHNFNTDLITDLIISKYSLERERLNELATSK